MRNATDISDNTPRRDTITTGAPASLQSPHSALEIPTNNLPAELTSFIGREREIVAAKSLLSTARLVTLIGAGGCGKTRLALRVAADLVDAYADGVWLVELAPLADPTLVPQAVAAILDVPEQPGQPVLDTLAHHIRAKHLLLVLDNCEHLVDACALLAAALLRACPDLQILATTREALGIAGESVWTVPSLSLPDAQQQPTLADLSQYEAIRLFEARAIAVHPAFRLSEANAAAVTQICQRLDGIPLAIELATARVKVLEPAEIAARLDDRFSFLTLGTRTAIPRHQTLRAAIDWSYDLLIEPERLLLRRLSVFAGGCTLEAAEQVCAYSSAKERILSHRVLDHLSHLVDKSLVLVDKRGDETRYRMLETIRQYANEKLSSEANESGESERIQDRHLKFFLHLAQAAEPYFFHAKQFEWFDRMELELDNIRAALAWSFKAKEWERGLGLITALFEFWKHRAHWREARAWLSRFLERVGQTRQTPLVARAFENAAVFAYLQGYHVESGRLIEASFAILGLVNDRQGIATALVTRGSVHIIHNEFATARACFETSIRISTELNDRYTTAHAHWSWGWLELNQENFARAAELFESSLALGRAQQNNFVIAYSLLTLGRLASRQQNYPQAIRLLDEALRLFRAANIRDGITWTLRELGRLAVYTGEYLQAREMLTEGLQFSNAMSKRSATSECLDAFAALAAAQGKFTRAARLQAASIALMQTSGIAIMNLQRRDQEQRMADLQSQMQEADFAQASAQGRAMTWEQAIAYALETLAAREQPAEPPAPPQTAKQDFGGLTARERQVAARIAQGESNREIAEALVVSERTVESHVTNILNKLGFTTRAQIRKWARERGLGARNP